MHRFHTYAALLLLLAACPEDPATAATTTSDSTTSSTGDPEPTSTTGGSTTSPDTSSAPSEFCGDGIINHGEACDDGNEVDEDTCTNHCTLATCGDGIVGPGEACDDGDADHCTAQCTLASCGDAIVQSGEDCDEGGSDTPTCDADCTAVACGDAHWNLAAGEACDDGNDRSGDTCSQTCASTRIVELAVGGEFVCILFDTGAVRCWGQGEYGVMGNGETDDKGNDPDELPTADIPLDAPVKTLGAGYRHVCAVLESGAVQCWGYDYQGQAGTQGQGHGVGDLPGEMPPPPVGLQPLATSIAAGLDHTCAVIEGGTVRCWGNNSNGELGTSTYEVDVPGITDVDQLALGANFSCARTTLGEVRCWGINDYGQLGLGHGDTIDTIDEFPPPAVDLGGDVAIAIDAGTAHACALLQGGVIRCWGRGINGALGNGGTADIGKTPESLPPPQVPLTGVVDMTAGNAHTCATLESGAVHCWGQGTNYGCLGYGDGEKYLAPPEMPVDLGAGAVLLSSSSGYLMDATLGTTSCALLTENSLHCWGNNDYGQLGLGHVDAIGDDETPIEARVPY